jgi:hypothetical protein
MKIRNKAYDKGKNKERIKKERRKGKIILNNVKYPVLTAASMKFKVFWDVAQCNHVEVDPTF